MPWCWASLLYLGICGLGALLPFIFMGIAQYRLRTYHHAGTGSPILRVSRRAAAPPLANSSAMHRECNSCMNGCCGLLACVGYMIGVYFLVHLWMLDFLPSTVSTLSVLQVTTFSSVLLVAAIWVRTLMDGGHVQASTTGSPSCNGCCLAAALIGASHQFEDFSVRCCTGGVICACSRR
jgi:hypothetical protein